MPALNHTVAGMTIRRRARARLAVIGLLGVCTGNVYVLRDVARLRHRGDELLWDPQVYSARLTPVRELVPGDSRIGYVNPGLQDDGAKRQDLFATRYALVPICVIPGTDQPLVLVAGHAMAALDSEGTTVLSDPQQRWRLIRRTVAP
jgi:hypothetical protein